MGGRRPVSGQPLSDIIAVDQASAIYAFPSATDVFCFRAFSTLSGSRIRRCGVDRSSCATLANCAAPSCEDPSELLCSWYSHGELLEESPLRRALSLLDLSSVLDVILPPFSWPLDWAEEVSFLAEM